LEEHRPGSLGNSQIELVVCDRSFSDRMPIFWAAADEACNDIFPRDPGRSALVPTPPSTDWGLSELGRTDDDATIVFISLNAGRNLGEFATPGLSEIQPQ